jgi:hypothetical protein
VELKKKKAKELEDLRIRRKQEEYMKTGKSEVLEGENLKHLGDGRVKHKLVSASKKYDPRVKKSKQKRAPVLVLEDSDDFEKPQTIGDYVKRQQIYDEREKFVVKPYQAKGKSSDGTSTSVNQMASPIQQRLENKLVESHMENPCTSSTSKSSVKDSKYVKTATPAKMHTCMTPEEAEKQKRAEMYLQARG